MPETLFLHHAKRVFNCECLCSIVAFACAWSAARGAFNDFVFAEPNGTLYWTLAMFFWFSLFGIVVFRESESDVAGLPFVAKWACSAVGILGLVVLWLSKDVAELREAALVLGIVLVCGSFCGLVRLWGEQNCSYDILSIVARVAGALMLTAILDFLLNGLSPGIRMCAFVVMLVLASISLSVKSRGVDEEEAVEPSGYLPVRWSWPLLIGVSLVLVVYGLI